MTDNTEKIVKKYKTFKEYYADPAFRERHLKYINEKIPCPVCGIMTFRHHMSRHKKSKKCQAVLQAASQEQAYKNVTGLTKEQKLKLICMLME